MAAIYLPERRFRQPADLVGVHPDWEGRVVSLIHFGAGAPVDVVDNRVYIQTGAVQSEAAGLDVVGTRTGAGTTTSGYFEASGALASFSGEVTTVFFLPQIGAAQDANGGMLYAMPAASKYTQFSQNGQQITVLGSAFVALGEDVRGTRNRTIIARGATGAAHIFIDTRKITGATGSIGTGAKTVRLGAWSSAGWQFNGVFGSVAVIRGAITDDEAYQLVENPWGLYEAEQSIIYSLPSGPITLNSLSVSNVTSSGARFTVSVTR